MQYVLGLLALLSFLFTLLTMVAAKSSMHEIVGAIGYLTSAVLLIGALVIHHLKLIRRGPAERPVNRDMP